VSLARFIEDGRLRPQIDRVVPLANAAEAVRHLETWHAHGKVVVRIE
jgi:NADPH:quinone reductase-like Zn-dependent oxidoreductase